MSPTARAVTHLSRLLSPTTAPSVRTPFVCARCLALPSTGTSYRTFSSTIRPQKKSASNPKSARKSPHVDSPDISRHVPDNQATRERDAEIDPYDFTELQAGIDKALLRLKDALTKTRDAGRVSTDMLESLPVELSVKDPGEHTGASSSSSGRAPQKEKTRLGDIASVVPRGGRSMQVFAAEAAHVKPLLTAIRASDYSLAPEQARPEDPNPLCITVPVPPVTAETRQQAAGEAKKCLERAQLEVRNARGEAQKRHRKMEIKKLVIVDELRKAHKAMEEVVKKGSEEARKIYEGALKALER
ncbi:uncharacterized protein HMPREF1541_10588 [Cyphellophora europaea CBS 101466]|uniref:Ribosome recycling factor domain-containing protein n=1 Tax=Cyphellophora europaea (strain CBS 101466) TaxID=1220924 RepID=W2S8R9_CYPE1|nr:uncharacterized protein HMPREF1541_10588 [Cyphellophora europaea CBS 101466]ETN44408.1 hypothetical protein HMPREF1541_10588 [Cyphellophora europaea CBS 101466]